jgi:predicted dehydrogenase
MEFEPCNQYTAQGDAVSRAIRGERSTILSLEDSVANMRVIDAIVASERSGGWARVG